MKTPAIHRLVLTAPVAALLTASMCSVSTHATVYNAGVSPAVSGVIGDHLVSPDAHPSVAGVGGSGLNNAAGSALDGQRTYIYDLGGASAIAAGTTSRGDANFAMMIWDMGTAFNSVRLYTHQDHYTGGPVGDNFIGQDLMEYSVWGSNDGDNFTLLSDVVGFNLNGGGPGLPTYTFVGTDPTVVYRGGSSEYGILNAYTRDYVFSSDYRYFGARASTVSIRGQDADPEIDAMVGFRSPPRGVPDAGATAWLLGLGVAGIAAARRKAQS